MRKPKVRELGEAIRALIGGPYTIRFPLEPVVPPANFRGKPEFQAGDCVGCGGCAESCPAGAIAVFDRTTAQPPSRCLELRLDQCIFCGQCELTCLTKKGIRLTQEFDLATMDRQIACERVEKELALCERCGAVVATREHLRFIAAQVGVRSFTHPGLLLAREEALGLAQLSLPAHRETGQRTGTMEVLCTRCRRAVVARELVGQLE